MALIEDLLSGTRIKMAAFRHVFASVCLRIVIDPAWVNLKGHGR
ncbi:MAG: hypothetical protein ACJ8AW_34430 [Rhodopila sp.]